MAIKDTQQGFALLIAVIFMSVMLSFGLLLGSLGTKQEKLASSALESQYAFYAADGALECVLYADQQLGSFNSSSCNPPSAPNLSCNGGSWPASCTYTPGASGVPNLSTIKYQGISLGSGQTADVTIYKYATKYPVNTYTTYIYSQGYDVSSGGANLASGGISTHY